MFNRDIAAWKFNADASNVDSVILAIGSGHILTSSNVSYSIGLYSSFVLGRTGYNNRWDISYQNNENFLVSYFDGNTYFKRFTVDYSTGNAKVRNVDIRNGNNPNCNAYYQLAFGVSAESAYEDYSQYRHNLRTSHSGIAQLNSENAVDLYLWDINNDTPDEIGSKHVVRWNAIGNEELISGFRIDGGVSFTVVTPTDKTNEQTNFAIPGKGVIYYNKSTNTYRYSVNGGLFNDLNTSGVSQPLHQIVVGTGSGLTSYSTFTTDGANVTAYGLISGSGLAASSLSAGGMVKSTSGTLDLAVAGTDYVSPSGLTTTLATYVTNTGLTTALAALGIAQPNNQIVVGNGSGITSYNTFKWISSVLTVTGSAVLSSTVTASEFIGIVPASSVGLQLNMAYGSGPILYRNFTFNNLSAQHMGVGTSALPNMMDFYGAPGSEAIQIMVPLTVSLGSGLVKSSSGLLGIATASTDYVVPADLSAYLNKATGGTVVGSVTFSSDAHFNGYIYGSIGSFTNDLTTSSTLHANIVVSNFGNIYNLTASEFQINALTSGVAMFNNSGVLSSYAMTPGQVSFGAVDYTITGSSYFTFDTVNHTLLVPNTRYGITHASSATWAGNYVLTQSSGYWVIPSGSNNVNLYLPANPLDGTMFCVMNSSSTALILTINGNGKNIYNSTYSGQAGYPSISPSYGATFLIYDLASNFWYTFYGII